MARAQIFACTLQQVVCKHARRRVGEDLRPRVASLDTCLQRGERQRRIAFAPAQQFAVDHRIARQRGERLFDFGKAPVQAFLAARPQRDVRAAADQLHADAVQFPFE